MGTIRRKRNTQLSCIVEDCSHEHYGHGYCEAHYKRWKRWGDPLLGKPVRPRRPGHRECSIDDCDLKHVARGYCGTHYQRWRTHGDPDVVLREHTGEFRTSPDGYRRRTITIDGKKIHQAEHRFLMEQLLGRPLRPGEEVHHLNTITDDNRIDGPLDDELKSGNLQLWYTSQPKGGRVVDLIEYVTDFHLAAAVARALANGRREELLLALKDFEESDTLF